MNLDDVSSIPLYVWFLLAIVLFTQSFLLFADARKRKLKRWICWFWGIWGLMQVPCPTLFYLLIEVKVWKRFKKNK